MDKNLLPIGTVVRLKNGRKKIVICGFDVKETQKSNENYDYVGYPYPEGFISKEFNLIFNDQDVEEVFYKGYVNNNKI